MSAALYVGRPWRARFLRAPKLALGLAARPGFVALADLADVRLGLKTGADKFFYLSAAKPSERGMVEVTGLDGLWTGTIAARDLQPAVLNPHELFKGRAERRLSIPKQTGTFYLRARARDAVNGLADYVRLAEAQGINRMKLVRANADGVRWYRQARGIVTSPWALPYNSGYDYGAWDNRFGAVLNGRFVGVSPRPDVDPELLGAVLNSTFVMATRLLEGTATGTEGAFDVGPPAARRMSVPDVRRLTPPGSELLRAAFDAWKSADVMPGGPTRAAAVDTLRFELDLAVLVALGSTKGEANAQVGRLYESYGRWRGAVEDVERAMRVYRREMSRNQSGRGMRPTELAARRVWEELAPDFPPLPASLLSGDERMEEVSVPRKLTLKAGQPGLFPGVIHLPEGMDLDLGSYERVRYLSMLLDVGFEPPLLIPTDAIRAGAIVDAFQRDEESLTARIESQASVYVTDADGLATVRKSVIRQWLRACRTAGMRIAVPDA